MHAVVTRVSVQDGAVATQTLREQVVPAVKQAPGFVAGYWVRLEGGDEGNSVVVFESEDAARQAAEQIRGGVGQNPGVTLNSVTVGEVVANA
jgi:heme-degrading monooxygenase HmoA